MTNTLIPQVTIHNVETDEVIIRDASAEELAQIEADKAEYAAYKAEADAKAAQRQALLERLGITQEEAQLLLGGK
jgi:hypothetical protein